MKIYKMARGVFNDYISETVRGKDTNEYVLRLKLSAMVNSTDVIIERDKYKIYAIGNFCIVVNNLNPDTISLVYWKENSFKFSTTAKEKLLKAYEELGLNPEGNKCL